MSDKTANSQIGLWAVLRSVMAHKIGCAGLLIITLLLLMAIFAPLLAPYNPNDQDLYHVLEGPSKSHWLGTDDVGRDFLCLWGLFQQPLQPLSAFF